MKAYGQKHELMSNIDSYLNEGEYEKLLIEKLLKEGEKPDD